MSRWDRPPEPKDWRYVVGTIGKVLITTGLLMFGFVAYQLWGTGIETARAQNQLESRFEDAVAAASETSTTEPPTSTPEPSAPSTTVPDESVDEPGPDAPPSELVPGAVDLSSQAIDQDIPEIAEGQAFARLEIPAIDKELYVVPGVEPDDLKKGPGHYPDTPLPGQLGNASIAGHRTTYGEPFRNLDQLEAGDELIVTMLNGDRFVYEVTGLEVVSPSDYWVVTTRDPDVAELTLTTCHPAFSARERLIVHSVLVPEVSDRVGLAEYYELDEAPGSLPGEEVDVVTTDAPPATTPTSSPEPAVDAGAPTTTAPEQPAVSDEPVDAFSRGWFDDNAAWPQIALWGIALVLIALAVRWISKRTRRDSIAVLVGVVPFVVCLYFFYQNINRLLPPGL